MISETDEDLLERAISELGHTSYVHQAALATDLRDLLARLKDPIGFDPERMLRGELQVAQGNHRPLHEAIAAVRKRISGDIEPEHFDAYVVFDTARNRVVSDHESLPDAVWSCSANNEGLPARLFTIYVALDALTRPFMEERRMMADAETLADLDEALLLAASKMSVYQTARLNALRDRLINPPT